MYARHLQPLVREMLGEFRIVYLTGLRQSGKTTLARSVAAELGMRYLTLDDPAIQSAAAQDPHGFVRSLEGRPVVLDEFQRAPDLVPLSPTTPCIATVTSRRPFSAIGVKAKMFPTHFASCAKSSPSTSFPQK